MQAATSGQSDNVALCRICCRRHMKASDGFQMLPCARSNCTPRPAGGLLFICPLCGGSQKGHDARWLAKIERIYTSAQIYHHAVGQEQFSFDPTGPSAATRSHQFVEFTRGNLILGDQADVQVIECGNGAAPLAFGIEFPRWPMHGSE